jgi:hypothetical protein
MQNVIAETLPAAIVASRDKAPEAPWTAPLGTARLFALLLLTVGTYSLFFMYKTARDLRAHTDERLTPWLYPPSVLIGLANAIAGARLASVTATLATPEQRMAAAAPGLIGALIFVAHLALTILGTVTVQSLWVLGLVLFTVPWLLLERQLNVVKLSRRNAQYRTRPYRFTKLQWAAVALGGLFWVLILMTLWQDVVRWRGTALAAGVAHADSQQRFSVTPPRDGWLIVAPGAVAEDAALELLGPGPLDWAVAHVTEQAGWELDALVDNRYAEISALDEDVQFAEKRELLPGTHTVVSRATYRGTDAFDGAYVYHVAAYVTTQRAVELIVYSAGPERARSGAEELARSLKPLPAKESALAQ